MMQFTRSPGSRASDAPPPGIDKPGQNPQNTRLFDTSNRFGSGSLANTSQARKRVRQNEKRRQHNMGQRSMVRTAIKQAATAAQGGDKTSAVEALKAATPIIDSMARKGIIHKNKAARHKSRLNQRIRTLSTA
jgi:small subunit ribosomal protein S20